jgi:hypothetical protein
MPYSCSVAREMKEAVDERNKIISCLLFVHTTFVEVSPRQLEKLKLAKMVVPGLGLVE